MVENESAENKESTRRVTWGLGALVTLLFGILVFDVSSIWWAERNDAVCSVDSLTAEQLEGAHGVRTWRRVTSATLNCDGVLFASSKLYIPFVFGDLEQIAVGNRFKCTHIQLPVSLLVRRDFYNDCWLLS